MRREEPPWTSSAGGSSDIRTSPWSVSRRATARTRANHFGDESVEAAPDAGLLKGEAFLAREGGRSTAASCFDESLRLYRALCPEDRLRRARGLRFLGAALVAASSGRDDGAAEASGGTDGDDRHEQDEDRSLECLDEALSLLMELGKDGTEDHAAVLLLKSKVHASREVTDLALLCLEVSHRVFVDLLGKDDLRVAEVAEHTGSCLVRDREHARAMEHFDDALRIRKLHPGRGDDLAAADVHFGMGVVHCENGNYNASLDSYGEALRIRRSVLGSDPHRDVAQILNNIGSVFARNGEYSRALCPWRDAISMYREIGLSDEHEKVACTLGNVAIAEKLRSMPRNRSQKEIRWLDSY